MILTEEERMKMSTEFWTVRKIEKYIEDKLELNKENNEINNQNS